MGFFDKLKEAAVKAKCATGFHAGAFTHIAGKPECHVEKTCPDCSKYLTQMNHKYPNEGTYEQERSCVMTWACVHCDETRTREVHEAFEKIGKDDYCRVKEQCQRCGHTRVGSAEHVWHKFPGNSEDTMVTYSCYYCNKEERRPEERY